jgi:hypothetical protein
MIKHIEFGLYNMTLLSGFKKQATKHPHNFTVKNGESVLPKLKGVYLKLYTVSVLAGAVK